MENTIGFREAAEVIVSAVIPPDPNRHVFSLLREIWPATRVGVLKILAATLAGVCRRIVLRHRVTCSAA